MLFLSEFCKIKDSRVSEKGGGKMKARQRKTWEIPCIVIVFILFASLCSYLNSEERIYRSSIGILLGMIRSAIYMGLFAAWGHGVRKRIVSKQARRYLTEVSIFLVAWMVTKTVKYYFVADPNVNRICWYLYYLPILFVPMLTVFVSLTLGQAEKFPLPKWALIFPLITTSLFVLVLCNDFHQWMFRFPENAKVFTDEEYSYAILYYVVITWVLLCSFISLGIMLSKCRAHGGRRMLWLPFVPIGVAMLYVVLYVMAPQVIRLVAPDVSVTLSLIITATLESCIQCGLIQSNTRYGELFVSSDLSVFITDENMNLFAAGDQAKVSEKSVLEQALKAPVMLDDVTRLCASSINGGYAFWREDVSEIAEALAESQDMYETLKERHLLVQEEVRTKQQKARLTEANRLYQKMQLETADRLERMQELIGCLEKEEEKAEQKDLLWELMLLGAYVKRRNNLLFLSETQEEIRPEELGYCLRESLAVFALQGAGGSFSVELWESMPLEDVMQLYDAFEHVAEAVLGKVRAMAVFVRSVADVPQLMVSLEMQDGNKIPDWEDYEIEEEAEQEFLLTYALSREEGMA